MWGAFENWKTEDEFGVRQRINGAISQRMT